MPKRSQYFEPLAPGQLVLLTGLKSRDDLNGIPAAVANYDTEVERWNVYADGERRMMAIREENLKTSTSDAAHINIESEANPPELVVANGRTAVVIARCGEALVQVTFIDSDAAKKTESAWVYLRPALSKILPGVATPLADADDDCTPTWMLPGTRILARDTKQRGGPKALTGGTVGAVRAGADGRLWAYVEWDTETASDGLWLSADELRADDDAEEEEGDDADDAFEVPPPPRSGGASGKKAAAPRPATAKTPKGGKAAAAAAAAGASSAPPTKRPLSAYMLWLNAEGREAIKAEDPALSFGEIGKACGAKWREMDAATKAPWEAQAAAAKQQHSENVAASHASSDKPPGDGQAARESKLAEPRTEPGAAGSRGKGKAKALAAAAGDTAGDAGPAGGSEKAARKRPMAEPESGAAPPPPAKARKSGGAASSSSNGGGAGSSSMADAESRKATSRKKRSAQDEAWEAALDAMQPAEGEEEAPPPRPAAPARDPRMKGFRIGGQAETEAERGEGWCGPWSTATRLIEQREAAALEREQRRAEGGAEAAAPSLVWHPKRDLKTERARRPAMTAAAAVVRGGALTSLQDLCVDFLVENIDAVASFGVLSGGVQHAIAAGLCRGRLLDAHALELLTQPDASVTELVVPDCSQFDEEALIAALKRLHPPPAKPTAEPAGAAAAAAAGGLWDLNPDDDDDDDDHDNDRGSSRGRFSCPQLSVVDLGYCGRALTPRAAALLVPLERLETLRLQGCFRLSNAALSSLLRARGGGLRSLSLSGNSQLGAEGVAAIGAHCDRLASLRLEDCDHLAPESLLPLRKLRKLETLSLGGSILLDDITAVALVDNIAPNLTSLSLRACSLVGPDAIASIARVCTALREIDLEGVELVTDTAVMAIAESAPALERIVLKGCVQLSDAAVEALTAGCPGLAEVSLNKVPALSDAALTALRQHCADTLRSLDISWCRGMTDHGLGALVDACEALETLTVWGCTQLTRTFYNGHSNDALRVIGISFGVL